MKYYKIVNPEGHRGMIYKEGLNVDCLPFNPKGNCTSGGIYFSREDILAFFNYGTEVYEVNPIGEVYENPGTPVKWKAHAVELKYIGELNDVNVIKMLVEDGADICAHKDYAVQCAARDGYLEVVKYLVSAGADIKAEDDCAVRWAAQEGHLEIVEYIKSLN